MKQLIVTYTLNIGESSEGLLPVVASLDGWTEESGMTVEDYIHQRIVIPKVSALFESVIFNAINPYFGIKDKAIADAVKEDYSNNFTITSELEEVV